jgi:hypothetical protein
MRPWIALASTVRKRSGLKSSTQDDARILSVAAAGPTHEGLVRPARATASISGMRLLSRFIGTGQMQ